MPDPIICPHCGGDRFAGQSADRVCSHCGNTFPALVGEYRRGRAAALWLVFSAICLVVAFGGVLLIAEGGDRSVAAAVGTVLLLLSVTAAVSGFYFSARAALVAPVVFLPGTPGRLLPADRAAAVIRMVALRHRAIHIVRQLDGIRPSKTARARAGFARAMTDDEVPLLLADDSFLRTGASGFLLTNRAIYSSRQVRPIQLEEVRDVHHRPPDKSLSLLEGWLVVIHVVFPPAILFLLPLALRRRHQRKNALLVNGRVVYSGDKNLAWDFWVEVLPAMAEELTGPRVKFLEVFPAAGEPLGTANPDWAAVEQVIRSLNGDMLPVVRLWAPGRASGLEIAGGNGRYTLRRLPAGWAYHNAEAGGGTVEVYSGHTVPAHSVCTNVQRVLRVARRFAETGSVE